ncbi:MerR family transcriptional regulator [Robertmurraya korlensis]|uniref:MerR family transcriptional regulator n=1 Tax=Robertmurraya korlensis TaxID=519977 RepID=UPI00082466DD|nr:MerR family transcriptional regulator [Robertmurraya korlensis]
MEYTVQKLGQLAGVSTRTLRYYDQIGLLQPSRVNSNGYRIYGQSEVNRLQQILFYKELGVNLDTIKEILSSPTFDAESALREHRLKLIEKRNQIETLICNVEKSIAQTEGRTTMSNKEKFEGFKQNLLAENEKKYGKEIRDKYGKENVEQSNTKLMNLSEEDYQKVTALEQQIRDVLAQAFTSGNPAGPLAQQAAELHKQWLCYFWPTYSIEAHAGLAQMYVGDERFTAYYDKDQPGTAEFLRDAILIYTK